MEELKSNFNIDNIRKTIIEINKELKKMHSYGEHNIFNLEMNINEMFPDFYNDHPALVKKICKGDDIETLNLMLNNLEQVENGKKTLPEVEKKLGDDLFNKYMKK
jgi:hypothetical protein